MPRYLKDQDTIYRIKLVQNWPDGRTSTSFQGPYSLRRVAKQQASRERRLHDRRKSYNNSTLVVTTEVMTGEWQEATE